MPCRAGTLRPRDGRLRRQARRGAAAAQTTCRRSSLPVCSPEGSPWTSPAWTCRRRCAKLVADFESGKLSRRQLVSSLMRLGAALATLEQAHADGSGALAAQTDGPTFHARGLDHIALDVTEVPRSRDFYAEHLGLSVIRGDDNSLFMGTGNNVFLTLFRAKKAAWNHCCYGIADYSATAAVEKLRAVGIEPIREDDRVYFLDPDGLKVQVALARS